MVMMVVGGGLMMRQRVRVWVCIMDILLVIHIVIQVR